MLAAVLPLRLFLPAVLVALVLTGCGSKSSSKTQLPTVPPGAAAVVGDQVVPKWRVDNLLRQAQISYTHNNIKFPKRGSVTYQSLKERATAYLVVGAMYLDRARAEGIVVSDADVDAAIAKIRAKTYGGSVAKQEAAWKRLGITPAEARAEQRLKLVEQRIQAKLQSRIKVSDAELQAYYDKNKSRFSIPERRSIRMILVHSLPLAQQIEQQLKNGGDFVQLVRRYSTDPTTKPKQGLLVVARGQGDKKFQDAVFGLDVGQISEPLKAPDGTVRIITPLGPVQKSEPAPLTEIKPALLLQMTQKRRQTVVGTWQTGVKDEYCGKKIAYADGYAPHVDTDACGLNRPVPNTG
jgi:foldase protein PrsA